MSFRFVSFCFSLVCVSLCRHVCFPLRGNRRRQPARRLATPPRHQQQARRYRIEPTDATPPACHACIHTRRRSRHPPTTSSTMGPPTDDDNWRTPRESGSSAGSLRTRPRPTVEGRSCSPTCVRVVSFLLGCTSSSPEVSAPLQGRNDCEIASGADHRRPACPHIRIPSARFLSLV